MKFDVEGAKKAGYSDEEIQSFLAKETAGKSFDVEGAKKAGYSDEEIDDFLSRGKYIGKEGKIIGGMLGGALQATGRRPTILATEAPVAAAKAVEGPIHAAQAITEGAQKLFGSKFQAPELKKTAPSDYLKKFVRSHLSEDEIEGAEDVSDIESLLIPFIKFRGKGAPKALGAGKGTPPPEPPVGPSGGPTSFQERAALAPGEKVPITEDLKAAGKAIKEKILGPNLSEEIPKTISPERIKNTTTAGMELENSVASTYKKLSAQEKKAYDLSRAANSQIEAVHPELVQKVQNFLQESQSIIDPSAPVEKFIESNKRMLGELAEIAPDGTVIGYKPISNQKLITQIQEYNQIPKYQFPTDTKNGIFKPLIRDITQAVDTTTAKFPEANQAWQQAKALHAEKSALFEDPDVSRWIKLADKNYSKDYISSIDIDKIRKIEPVLKRSEEGRKALQQMKREIVEKTLEDNFTIGKRFDKKQIANKLSELEPILSPQELEAVEQLFKESQTLGARALSLTGKIFKYSKSPSSILNESQNLK